MKRFIASVLCFLALILSVAWIPAEAASQYRNGDTVVYITRTGECYHREWCSYLRSKIETNLERAVNSGYRACSRCDPPILQYATPTPKPTKKPTSQPILIPTKTPTPTPTPSPTPTLSPTPYSQNKNFSEQSNPVNTEEKNSTSLQVNRSVLAGMTGLILMFYIYEKVKEKK